MSKRKKTNGFTIIITIFITLSIVVFASLVNTFMTSESKTGVENFYSLRAFYIANAGYEYYIEKLSNDDNWLSPPADKGPKSFMSGVFIISTTDEASDYITYTSTGILTVGAKTYRRAITASYDRNSFFIDDYVLLFTASPESGVYSNILNNGAIDGNIYLNGDLAIGSNVTIDGSVYATGNVTGTLNNITGTHEAHTPLLTAPPELDTTYYDAEIALAQQEISADMTFTNTTISGTIYVNGDVVLSNDVNIVGDAKIIATGSVHMSNNVNIGSNLELIADGAVTLGNNVNVGASGTYYSSTSITSGNNTQVGLLGTGQGTVFITPGDVTIWNNANFNGMVYAGGTMYIKNNIEFRGYMMGGFLEYAGNNSEIIYDPTVINSDNLVGIGSEQLVLMDWREVY